MMKPPRIDPNAKDFPQQLETHIGLIWEAIEKMQGIGGRTIRLHGPLDLRGLPPQNMAPAVPTEHAPSHANGGRDEIGVAGLAGLLADNQVPFLMAAAQRGGAKLGDVFSLVAEVLTVMLHGTMGIQKKDNTLALKQQSPIPSITTADASDPATTQALVNEIKASLNLLLALLKAAEIMPSYKGYFARSYFSSDYFADVPSSYFSAAA